MEQLSLFDAASPWTVTNLTRYLRSLIENDEKLKSLWVQGEISNLARPASGHVYFTLKDNSASLRCVMWKSDAFRLQFPLRDGAAIEAHGYVSIYETSGQYQFYVDSLRPVGEGELYKEFVRLKALLEGEGLFNPERKRTIPESPRRIGVVTSRTGAALRDVLNTLRRRMPLAEVILSPAPVQGAEAPLAIIEALRKLNEICHPDVILLVRGGGSIEDLWSFNDERVVRAVVDSAAPVISGVGHETDFTLVDFAADLRAPTPTASAELASPVTMLDLRASIAGLQRDLITMALAKIDQSRLALSNAGGRLERTSPLRKLQTERQSLDDLSRRWSLANAHRLEIERVKLLGMLSKLETLNPESILKRGYAVVTKERQVIKSISNVRNEDRLSVRVQDGKFDVRVTKGG